MDSSRTGTFFMTASALLWVVLLWLAGSGHWFPALFVLLLLLLVYGLLGSSNRGRIDFRLVAFPIVAWLVLWAAAFFLGNHYAEAFNGRRPEFTILGFHPSFAAIIALYWVIPTLLMAFGFEAVKERWLSQRRWDDFVNRMRQLDTHPADEERGDE